MPVKKIIRKSIICFATVLFAVESASSITPRRDVEPIIIDGMTMGTTYHITYFDKQQRNFKTAVDSLLQDVNRAINNYDPLSEVSLFNATATGISFQLPHLLPVLKKSEEIFRASDGAFDLTVMPLVNAWGFGPAKARQLSSHEIDSIRNFIGFEKLQLSELGIQKSDPRIQLDLGGIGQGYGVDVIADFFRKQGIENFLVELGGEGIASGKNLKKNKYWQIGILDPNSTQEEQFFKAYVTLKNQSFTTAGNYFNYRVIDGRKYGHTIDPKTGYPVINELLSVSVFASDCTTADGWDTAFIAMGLAKTFEFLDRSPAFEVILMYSTPQGKIEMFVTPGLRPVTQFE